MMQTKIYFVRHAQSHFDATNEQQRPLTAKGMADTPKVSAYLRDKEIHEIYSSPYLRAVQTLTHFSKEVQKPILQVDAFRERKVGTWIPDFEAFAKGQWADFDYKEEGGESLREVQKRNIEGLMGILKTQKGKHIAIGTHGTALSTILNYFDKTYDYDAFKAIVDIMPILFLVIFEGEQMVSIEKIMLEIDRE